MQKLPTSVQIGITSILGWIVPFIVTLISMINESIQKDEFTGPNKWAAIGAIVIFAITQIFRYLQSLFGEAASASKIVSHGRTRLGLPEVREAINEDPEIVQQLRGEGLI